MGLKFSYNGTTYSCADSTTKYTTPSICFNEGGATKYVPASTSRGTSVTVYTTKSGSTTTYYKINNSSPSLCFSYNGSTYYAAKSITTTSSTYVDVTINFNVTATFGTAYGSTKYATIAINSSSIQFKECANRTIYLCVYAGAGENVYGSGLGSIKTMSATATSVDTGTAGYNYTSSATSLNVTIGWGYSFDNSNWTYIRGRTFTSAVTKSNYTFGDSISF